METLITIVIPHFNRFELLQQTLNSVINQTYQEWEVIIIDDYSSLDCLKSIMNFISNEPKIKLVNKTNQPKGAPASRNMGLNFAHGKYVLFLDSDDILAPFALEQRVQLFSKSNYNLHAVVAPTLLFNKFPGDKQEVWNKFDSRVNLFEEILSGHSYFNTMSALWLRTFIAQIGGWDESLTSYQDWELHLRALLKGMLYKETMEYDNFYRTHSDAQSIAIRFFDEDIAKGRFNAFSAVFRQLKASSRKDLMNPFRAFVIRHVVQLIDHQKNDIVKNVLENRLAYGLKWWDVKVLTQMLTDGHAWRYRTATKYLTKIVWHDLAFDPWLNNSSNKLLENSDIKAFSFDYQKILNFTSSS